MEMKKHMRESGFYHIFSHFKRFYLPEIFPLWNPADRLYTLGNGMFGFLIYLCYMFLRLPDVRVFNM